MKQEIFAIAAGSLLGMLVVSGASNDPTAKELDECSEARHALIDATIAFNKRNYDNQDALGKKVADAYITKTDKCYWEK